MNSKPKKNELLLADISARLPTLTPTLRRVASYILEHPAEATLMSVDEFSNNAGVSVASVYRFCRELDFQTFSRLKLAIAKEVSSQSVKVQGAAENRADIGKLFDEYVRCLDQSEGFLDEALARTVARLIAQAEKTIIVGVGASSVPASYLHVQLLEEGVVSHRPTDLHLAGMLAANLSRDDVLVALSASGATRDIVELAGLARKGNAAVVGITSYYSSPLEDISTHHLLADSEDSPITSGSGASVISQLAVASAIVEELRAEIGSIGGPEMTSEQSDL